MTRPSWPETPPARSWPLPITAACATRYETMSGPCRDLSGRMAFPLTSRKPTVHGHHLLDRRLPVEVFLHALDAGPAHFLGPAGIGHEPVDRFGDRRLVPGRHHNTGVSHHLRECAAVARYDPPRA